MGFLAPALTAVGDAATAVGSATGLTDVASSLGSLFTGGGAADAATAAGAADAATAAGAAGAAGGAGAVPAGAAGGLASGSGFLPALSNIGHAITGATAPSEAGYLASLGQAVPQGVELAGPSSTFAGPGFMQGLVQGFTGTAGQLASPSAGTSAGVGVGQLFDALSKMSGGGVQIPQSGQTPQPIVHLGDLGHAATRLLSPGPPGQPDKGPIMSLFNVLGSL